MEDGMFEYRLEHITSYNATLAEPEVIGPVAEGLRLSIYATGGAVTGPKVLGEVRPVGADWLTVRRDATSLHHDSPEFQHGSERRLRVDSGHSRQIPA
jgi:hypothetical protein